MDGGDRDSSARDPSTGKTRWGGCGRKSKGNPPSFPFLIITGTLPDVDRGPPNLPSSVPLTQLRGRCGGKDAPGGLGIPAALELIP